MACLVNNEECNKSEWLVRGLCKTHYNQWYNGDKSLSINSKSPPINVGKECKVEGCISPARKLGMCNKHYQRFKKYGDPSALTERECLLSIISEQKLAEEYKLLNNINVLADKYGIGYTAMKKILLKNNIKVSNTKRTLNVNFFKQETPETFYVAGFLAADGSIHIQKSNNAPMLDLSIKDLDHLENIKKLLQTDVKIYKRIVRNSERNSKYNDSVAYSIKISRKSLIKDLEKFNIVPNKSLTYKMPDWIINHKYVNYFLLGYFDGDGSISINKVQPKHITPQASIHIRGTVNFLQEFHTILYNNCELPKKDKKISIDSNIGSLQYSGNNIVSHIMKFLYNKPIIYLQRKYKIFQQLQKIINNRNKK